MGNFNNTWNTDMEERTPMTILKTTNLSLANTLEEKIACLCYF
jgi:hypothetical protein